MLRAQYRCHFCGEVADFDRATRRYCSSRCRQAARRWRLGTGRQEPWYGSPLRRLSMAPEGKARPAPSPPYAEHSGAEGRGRQGGPANGPRSGSSECLPCGTDPGPDDPASGGMRDRTDDTMTPHPTNLCSEYRDDPRLAPPLSP